MTPRGTTGLVLIFRGTHQVLSAEKAVKGAGVAAKVVPVPRFLSSDCGLALLCPAESIETVRAALAAVSLAPASAHLMDDGEEVEKILF